MNSKPNTPKFFWFVNGTDLSTNTDSNIETESFYLNIRLDGYSDPSLFSVAQQLRYWFYENLSLGIPFKTVDEVKDALYLVLYQEIVQFMQFYCRTWGIQIAGNRSFQGFCYRLMENLAVGQLFYLIQTALEYLYKQKALQVKNEKFINTNLLKKTLRCIVTGKQIGRAHV